MKNKRDNSPKFTSDNIEIEECYYSNPNGSDLKSRPGEFPYLRGIHSNMYRGRPWTMRQYSGFGSVSETNERFKYLIKTGASGLSVAFDLPTQMGFDSDDKMAEGEVGKTGVAVDTVEDVQKLFQDIPLDQISSSMTINATAHILLAFYLVAAERAGIPWNKLSGTVQNDPLKEFIARGTYIFGPKFSLRITRDIIQFCSENVPSWNPISVSGYHMREAGCTAAQEIAFTLLNGITYIESVLEKGIAIDEFAPRIAFFLSCNNNFFEEIAKFRASRMLWAKLVKDRYSPKNPKSLLFRFHTQTAGSSLTAQQPLNNVVRTSYQALAAVLGGTQSLHTNSYDEAISLPSEDAALLALRTQQVLLEETSVSEVVDPLGGSFFVESLTEKLVTKSLEIIRTLEENGGMIKSLIEGLPQKMIEDAAYQFQLQIESGVKKIIGVNSNNESFSESEELKLGKFTANNLVESSQISQLTAFKKGRNQGDVQQSLSDLAGAAATDDNLMPFIVNCARKNATLGEITKILEGVFGRYGQ